MICLIKIWFKQDKMLPIHASFDKSKSWSHCLLNFKLYTEGPHIMQILGLAKTELYSICVSETTYFKYTQLGLYLTNANFPHWHCPKVSTTPLRQWGFRQWLPFSWTTLRGKHCRHPIAVMGVVDTIVPGQQEVSEHWTDFRVMNWNTQIYAYYLLFPQLIF